MTPSEVDYQALTQIAALWAVAIIFIYLVILILLRASNYYRIKRCPNCDGGLKRAQRTSGDRFVKNVSFGILPIKRYRCYTCYWEGVAMQIKDLKKTGVRSEETV